MRPPVSRAVRWAGALALAAIVAIAVFGSGGSRPDEPPTAPTAPAVAQTEFGPLSPSDVELLVKVRQAGLWEIPTGQQMQQRATRAVVADVGRLIALEHTELDAITRQTADQLGVTLPSQPSAQQQAWMGQITASTGPDYDRVAINLLRLAHGTVLPFVAQVRSGTRNDLVREFATTAATFVTRHHEYLESTGLVDFAALPEPAAPAAPAPASQSANPQLAANSSADSAGSDGLGGVLAAVREASLSSYLAAAVAFAAVIGAGALLDMVVRGRSRPGPAGPAPGPYGAGYPPMRPFPAAPPPPRGRPRRRTPSRGPGPAAFGLLVVAVLVLPPTLERAMDTAPPPQSPSRSAALAAGFAALDPAPDHVLALVAATRDGNSNGDKGSDEGEQGRDVERSGDNADDGVDRSQAQALEQALAERNAEPGINRNAADDGGNGDEGGANDQNDQKSGGNDRNDQNQDDQGNERNQNNQGDQGNNEGDQNNQGNNNDQGNDNEGNQNDQGNQGDQGAGQDDADEFPGREDAALPARDDFVDIGDVNEVIAEPTASSDASRGSYVAECGEPEAALRNSDNWIVAPGKVNGAQHMHDYLGSSATDAFTSAGDLLESETTCTFDDRSTFFWPVLRDTARAGPDQNEDGGGRDGNVGEILEPAQVVMQFVGNATGPVQPMPQLLRVITGDAKAVTNGADNVRAQWSCRGFEDRATTQYPVCPAGSRLLRVLDFPSCWDGQRLDSEDHRSHIVFPDEQSGACPNDTVAVPQLRMILAYDQPGGIAFAVDSFPDQQHHPATDHGDFVNGMPQNLMAEVVQCINEGLQC